jgi:hypothetical protein
VLCNGDTVIEGNQEDTRAVDKVRLVRKGLYARAAPNQSPFRVSLDDQRTGQIRHTCGPLKNFFSKVFSSEMVIVLTTR